MNGSGVLRAILFGIAVTSLAACGDCGAGAEDAGSGSDAYQAPHDAAGVDTVGTDRSGQDTYQPPTDAARTDTVGTDLRGQDTYQPPTDAAGHDSATGTDASTCPTRVCDGVCCQAGEVCSLLDGECCTGSCAGKDCGDDGCGTSCGTCTDQMCDSTQHCVPITTPPNDSCGGAIALAFDGNGVATVHGDTVGATGDSSSFRCGLMPGDQWPGGKDVVYTFTLSEATPMTFALRYSDTTQPMLYLSSACPVSTLQDELFCNVRDGLGGAGAHIRVAAGTYFVWVDSTVAGSGGSFTLVVSKDPIPANDTCAGGQALDVSSGHVAVAVDTTDATNDYTGTCGNTAGPDLVYSFTTSAVKQVVVQVSSTNYSLYPAVYVRSACASGAPQDEVACAATTSNFERSATATVDRLPAGTYFVFVDGGNLTGLVTLDLTVSDPPVVPDDCASAQTLTFGSDGTVQVQANFATGTNDMAPAGCGGAGPGNDLVYTFNLATPKTVTVGMSGFYSMFYVRSACASTAPADELGCQLVNEYAEIALPRLAAGDYWIWIDETAAGAGGSSWLRVTTVTPPAGDTCDDVQDLAFDGQLATRLVDPTGAFDDYEGSCAHYGDGETVYAFTLQQQAQVVVSASYESGLNQFGLYLRSACTSALPADEIGCAYALDPMVPALLPAGTYYVFVEAMNAPFNLTVEILETPLNDTCAGAIAIDVGQTVSGYNLLATDDYGASGLSAQCDYLTADGPDLVYSFVPPAAGFYQISSTGSQFFVWATTTCGSEADCVAYDSGRLLAAEAGTTYYLIVDSESGMPPGAFEFTVQAVPSPANDTCAGAIPITLDEGAYGTTIAAYDDYGTGGVGGVCTSGVYDGPDVVYSFVAPADATYSLGLNCYDVTAWVTTSCGSEAHCVGDSSTGWTFVGASGTTYYIVVDSWAASLTCEFDLGIYQQ